MCPSLFRIGPRPLPVVPCPGTDPKPPCRSGGALVSGLLGLSPLDTWFFKTSCLTHRSHLRIELVTLT